MRVHPALHTGSHGGDREPQPDHLRRQRLHALAGLRTRGRRRAASGARAPRRPSGTARPSHLTLLVGIAPADDDEHGVAVGRIDDIGPRSALTSLRRIRAMNSSPAIAVSIGPPWRVLASSRIRGILEFRRPQDVVVLATSSDQQRARVARQRQGASLRSPPRCRGAYGLDPGSAHACPDWLLSDDAQILTLHVVVDDVLRRTRFPALIDKSDLAGLDAAPAPTRRMAGGEHGREVREPERPRLVARRSPADRRYPTSARAVRSPAGVGCPASFARKHAAATAIELHDAARPASCSSAR